MIEKPLIRDPAEPETRSAGRFLRWVLRQEAGTVALGILWGCLWMASMALTPYAIGQAVDEIVDKDTSGVVAWTGVIVALAVVTAAGSALRHRCDTIGRIRTSYRVIYLVTRQATRLGDLLDKRAPAGELVAIGTTDISHLGSATSVVSRGVAGALTIVMVAGILLSNSVVLGLLVLIGAPLLLVMTGPLMRPLHKRVWQHRDLQAALIERAGDIVSGLRVLRGIGGEAAFRERYRHGSRQVRDAGVRVARVTSVIAAAEVLLPGVFVVGVVWIGARLAVDGALTAGDLVAFYGYAAFLMLPMRAVTGTVEVFVAAVVAARRVIRVLDAAPDPSVGSEPVVIPDDSAIVDSESGLVVRPGSLTAVAATSPEQGAQLADRLGRYGEGTVTFGGVPLEELPLEQLRRHILVTDNDAHLFNGVLSDEIGAGSRDRLNEVLHSASAWDIVEALPEGVGAPITERGRCFSSGQQQRLRLARALAADPQVLVLVEPTNALDAHTESLVAERLRAARVGRTTVVITTSPLLLDHADEVVYLDGGRVAATGSHHDLVHTSSNYAATMLREEF